MTCVMCNHMLSLENDFYLGALGSFDYVFTMWGSCFMDSDTLESKFIHVPSEFKMR